MTAGEYDQRNYGITMTSAREVLAANLNALKASHAELNTLVAIQDATEKIGRRVSKSTIQRTLKKEDPIILDNLEALAAVFGLDPWQLLTPNLDPKNPPVLRSIGETEDQLYKKIKTLAQQIATLEK